MQHMSVSRREFLKVAGALGLVAATGGSLPLFTACGAKVKTGQTLKQRGNTVMNAADQASGGLGNEFNAGR